MEAIHSTTILALSYNGKLVYSIFLSSCERARWTVRLRMVSSRMLAAFVSSAFSRFNCAIISASLGGVSPCLTLGVVATRNP